MFQNNANVAVLGASGGIGQPLSLLLKMSPFVSKLNLYDINHTPGVAADLSHISTKAKVKGFLGPEQLDDCLKGAEVVLIPAGVPRKPGKFHIIMITSMEQVNITLILQVLFITTCILIHFPFEG